jgi:hypothetical protein
MGNTFEAKLQNLQERHEMIEERLANAPSHGN